MIKKPSKDSLADKIAGLLSAIPAQFNPDDEDIDETTAKLTEINDLQEENDEDEAILSTFRKQNVDLLADVDQRYSGKRGSRKNLKNQSSDEEESNNEGENDSEEDNDSEVEDNNVSDEQKSDSENEDISEEESENESSIDLSETEDTNFQNLTETNVSEQVKKGLSVRNQLNIWENLLEMRIQMQKCLVAANRLPQKTHYDEMLNSKSDFKNKIKETKDSLSNVLDKFLNLQNLLLKKYPETKNLGKSNENEPKVGSDEEIPSDTEDDIEEESEKEEQIQKKSKKRKLNEYEKDISDIHKKYIIYRNDTIEKWNTKTRLSVIKNSGQSYSVIDQIEHILTDKEKLRKRTQLNRSQFKILGQEDTNENILESNEDNGDVKRAEEYNPEIFDDSDFYHQLLRELIEVKSSDIMDPVQLGRQWIQLQNLRSKMKRKIDTRATKGRKIRYAVHTKLVNFMAPYDHQLWTEEAKDRLYGSLFGKTQGKSV